MTIDLQWIVSSLTLSIPEDSTHCNWLMHGKGARFLQLSPSTVFFRSLTMVNILGFPLTIFFYVLRTAKEYSDFC
jgi:hypothetical protein